MIAVLMFFSSAAGRLFSDAHLPVQRKRYNALRLLVSASSRSRSCRSPCVSSRFQVEMLSRSSSSNSICKIFPLARESMLLIFPLYHVPSSYSTCTLLPAIICSGCKGSMHCVRFTLPFELSRSAISLSSSSVETHVLARQAVDSTGCCLLAAPSSFRFE